MPDPDKSGDEPNLELPSFGFRRKKKDKRTEPEPVAEQAGSPEPVEQEPVEQAPIEQAPEPTEVIAPAATETVPPVAAVPTAEAPAPAPAPAQAEPQAAEPATASAAEPPAIPNAEPAAEPPVAATVPVQHETAPAEVPVDAPAPRPRRQREPMRLPVVPGPVAAVVTGLVCGFVTVFLAFASARGCQAVRGVGSCGGFGLVALLVVLTLTVLIGSLLLRGLRVSDPTSTSFLGIGLMAVVVMLFFLGTIDSLWMLAVIPVLTGATFLLSWWVTTKFVDVGDELRRS